LLSLFENSIIRPALLSGATFRDKVMSDQTDKQRCPFRPTLDDIKSVADDIAEIGDIQQLLKQNHPNLHCRDRVAHQYQIAGSKVNLLVVDSLPAEVEAVGLFQPGAEYQGIGRISTGLGTPHIETNPDFLGLMLAFQTREKQRVDFLSINDPASPAQNHKVFVDVLAATAAAAGESLPLIGDWGEYNLGDLLAEQKEFGLALKNRLGWMQAGKTLGHIVKQTFRTFNSSTAYQSYWTGIVELTDKLGKFTLVPVDPDSNPRPGFRPGKHYLSDEWRARLEQGAIEFHLYWIPFLNEEQTPTMDLSERWQEEHKTLVASVTFPMRQNELEQAKLFSLLAAEMGANPGNWVRDRNNSIAEPATVFGLARKLAYQASQDGRDVLAPQSYQCIFDEGQINPVLEAELERRRSLKKQFGHVSDSESDLD